MLHTLDNLAASLRQTLLVTWVTALVAQVGSQLGAGQLQMTFLCHNQIAPSNVA